MLESEYARYVCVYTSTQDVETRCILLYYIRAVTKCYCNGHALCMVNGVGKEDVEGSDRWQKDLSNPPPPLGWEQHTYPHLLRKRLRPCLHGSHHPWRHNSRRCTHLWEEQWEGGAERGLG